MKELLLILVSVLAAAAGTRAATLETEAQALDVLSSTALGTEKEAACLRLKQTGTARAVPVLKGLIADEGLAQWAVDALEHIPGREASEALLQVLPVVTGRTKALVVFALGVRREPTAVTLLATLLLDSDSVVAAASAKALGMIANEASLATLQAAKPATRGPVHGAVCDALLACADQLLAVGNATGAVAVYAPLRQPDEPGPVRAAAFRGTVLCAGNRQGALLLETLTAGDAVEQAMAIQLARELPGADITALLAGNLARVSPLIQVALLDALRQRGDPAAASHLPMLAGSSEAAVRIASLQALGELGDGSHVNLLASRTASGPAVERSEARQALLALHRGDVRQALVSELQRAQPEVKVELVQVLARRMDRGATANLLRFAAGDDDKLAVASIQALERLADDAQMPALLDLIIRAPSDVRRDAAVTAFAAVGTRSRRPAEYTSSALKAVAGATVESQCGLLEAAAQIGGGGVLEALRAALRDPKPEVRASALRVMSEYAGDEARPDLLAVVQTTAKEADRTLALRGYWRLVESMSDRPQAERFVAVRDGLTGAKSPDELRLGLARLGELRGAEALELAQRYRTNGAVRAEAEVACLQIASQAEGTSIAAAESVLNRLATEGGNDRVRAEAKSALAKLEGRTGFITTWLVSGPYREEGKEAQQLFDVAFAPEGQGRAEWRTLAVASGMSLDLLPVAGGNHCVVYLKARVFCPKGQPVALEIGTDDGVKLWVNGDLVHANNAVRGFTLGEDKVKTALKEGWNAFLVKVTQHTAGCAASVRVRSADGKTISGLRAEIQE